MPTHEELTRFLREWAKLTPPQQTLFLAAVNEVIEDLRAHRSFRPSLRIEGVQGHPGIFEMTWANNGRATFHYGAEQRPGDAHIVWRRISSHDIFQEP